jgi:hypothetical protein
MLKLRMVMVLQIQELRHTMCLSTVELAASLDRRSNANLGIEDLAVAAAEEKIRRHDVMGSLFPIPAVQDVANVS